jgi:hypothetical protein
MEWKHKPIESFRSLREPARQSRSTTSSRNGAASGLVHNPLRLLAYGYAALRGMGAATHPPQHWLRYAPPEECLQIIRTRCNGVPPGSVLTCGAAPVSRSAKAQRQWGRAPLTQTADRTILHRNC